MGATTRRSLGRNARKAGRMFVIISLVTSIVPGEAVTTSAQSAPAEKVRIERGQVLVMSLGRTVDSGSAKTGDRVELRLVRPVMSGDKIVLPAGWIVPAHISKVHRAGKKNCRNGRVAWKLDPMTAPGGTKIQLTALPWAPYGPNGKPTERVHIKSSGEKFGKTVEDVEIAPLMAFEVILLLPMVLGMELSEGEPCRGRPGAEDNIEAGTISYAAIARDVRIEVNPATP